MERAEPPGAGSGAKRGPGPEPEPRKRRRSLLPAPESQGATVLHQTVSYAPHHLSARQFDQDTTEPVSFYLSSLEELLGWEPTSDDDFNVASVPLAERQPPLHSKRPRTLLCHDMKNGYLEDRFIQGSAAQDPYVFYHWHYIDIFVYFSHHTVTIPPVTWTNAAHRNGVSVLGTFITEWSDGSKVCESFLAGEANAYQAVAKQLVDIAHFYCFDGWLVNIENTLSEAAVKNLPLFLHYLRDQLQQAVPGGLVIWYDSVLQNGELIWQNELNKKNRVFFDACDGLFTNYNWEEEHLERMQAQAGERLADVYVGIDVFARGKVVGGGFETDKPLHLIRKYGFSAAIFAPGWVYEHLGKEGFLRNENKFWSLLTELLPTHSISSLPFSTSFCLGMGKGRFSAGQEEEVGPWYNLSAQDIQPLFTDRGLGQTDSWLCSQCSLQDAWNGGSCLLIEGAIPPDTAQVTVRLFSLQLPAPHKLFLSLVYKLEAPPEVAVDLELTTRDTSSCLARFSALHGLVTQHQPQLLTTPAPHLSGLPSSCGKSVAGWLSRCYELELGNCTLQDLSLILSCRPLGPHKRRFSCHIGEMRVLDATSLHSSVPQVPSLEASQLLWQKGPGTDHLSLSLTLRWSYPPHQACCFRIYCQGAAGQGGQGLPPLEKPQLLGLAHATLYRVVGLTVRSVLAGESSQVDFFVEPVLNKGVTVDRSRWGRLVLVYSDPASPNT